MESLLNNDWSLRYQRYMENKSKQNDMPNFGLKALALEKLRQEYTTSSV